MTEPLKPCPICGKHPSIQSDGEGTYKVKCDQFDHRVVSFGMSKEEAITAWNRRAEPDDMPGWMREKINEKLMPGSRPWNYETKVIMNTLEWVLSLNKGD